MPVCGLGGHASGSRSDRGGASGLQEQQNPLCAALGADANDPPVSVALVGNGPLSIEQREAINATERVVSCVNQKSSNHASLQKQRAAVDAAKCVAYLAYAT